MKEITLVFKEIVQELNERAIFPIVYGSLGLCLKLEKEVVANDIDFIIEKPEEFLVCKKVFMKDGFKIDPNHERELIKNGLYVSFIDKSEIEKLINEPLKLELVSEGSVNYFNIDIVQYLKIYKIGLKNKDRKERKEKDDLEKIKDIKNYLENIH